MITVFSLFPKEKWEMKPIFLSKVSETTVLLNNVRAISMYFQYKRPKFLQEKNDINLKYAFFKKISATA